MTDALEEVYGQNEFVPRKFGEARKERLAGVVALANTTANIDVIREEWAKACVPFKTVRK
jgi:hypothetical protein